MRKKLLAGLTVLIFISQIGTAAAAVTVTRLYNRYSAFHSSATSGSEASADDYLRNSGLYKGYNNSNALYDYVVRYRSRQFDHRQTANWLGYGYNNYSNLVLECQRALGYLGYNPWENQDGVWGSTTYNAVRAFQSANGLSADGIVGRTTWRVMVYEN